MCRKKNLIKLNDKEYYLVEKIGEGGSGIVYKAKYKEELLAVKIMKETPSSNKKTRFENECNFSLNSDHHNIIKYLDYGTASNGRTISIMPIYHRSLRNAMKEDQLSFEEKMKIFLQISEGLKYIHNHDQKIIHRDLKPENILLDVNNDAVITDFGIAHFKDYNVTKTNERLLNINYHAPEQTIFKKDLTGSYTDIYSLGLILNELITGNIPKGEKYIKIRDINPLYSSLDDLVTMMTFQNFEDRITNVEIVIHEINFIFNKITHSKNHVKDNLEYYLEGAEEFDERTQSTILDIAANDILLAKELIYTKDIDFNKYNLNYNSKVSYKASKMLFNIALQQSILKKCMNQINYEGRSFNIDESVLENKERLLDDENLYNNMKKFLLKYPVNDSYYDYTSNILKTFSSIYTYHAAEIFRDLDYILKELEENIVGAPIIWIFNRLSYILNGTIVFERMKNRSFEFEYYVEVDWHRTQYYYNGDNYQGLIDVFNKNNEDEYKMILSKMKSKYNITWNYIDKHNMLVLFESYDNYKIFKEDALNESKPGSVFEGDVLDLTRPTSFLNGKVSLMLNYFDVGHTLAKVLKIREDDKQ